MIEFDVEFRSYTCTCRYDIHVFGYFKSFVVAKKKKNNMAWSVEIYLEMQKRLAVSVLCVFSFLVQNQAFLVFK